MGLAGPVRRGGGGSTTSPSTLLRRVRHIQALQLLPHLPYPAPPSAPPPTHTPCFEIVRIQAQSLQLRPHLPRLPPLLQCLGVGAALRGLGLAG